MAAKVVYTSTDQAGNFRIGEDFTTNQNTGTISGRAFTQSLFAQMTPFILTPFGLNQWHNYPLTYLKTITHEVEAVNTIGIYTAPSGYSSIILYSPSLSNVGTSTETFTISHNRER